MEPTPLAKYMSEWWMDAGKCMREQQPTTVLGWMVAFSLGAGALSAVSALVCASMFLMSTICMFGLVTLIGAGLFFGTWLSVVSVLSLCIAITAGSITLTAFASHTALSTIWQLAPIATLRMLHMLVGPERAAALLKSLQPPVVQAQQAAAADVARQPPAYQQQQQQPQQQQQARQPQQQQSPQGPPQQRDQQQPQQQQQQEPTYAPLSVANLRRHTRSTQSESSHTDLGVNSYEPKDPSSAADAVAAFVTAAAVATATISVTPLNSSMTTIQDKMSGLETTATTVVQIAVDASQLESASPTARQISALERLGDDDDEVYGASQGSESRRQAVFNSECVGLQLRGQLGGSENDIMQMMSLAVMQGEPEGCHSISPAMSTTSRRDV